MNIQNWFPLGLITLISLRSKWLSGVFTSTTVWKHQFFGNQPSFTVQLSHLYVTTGKTMALAIWIFVGKVKSLIFFFFKFRECCSFCNQARVDKTLHLQWAVCVSSSVMSDFFLQPHGNSPGSSVHGILQARILDWIAIFFFRRSSQHSDLSWVFHTAGILSTLWATREALFRELPLYK